MSYDLSIGNTCPQIDDGIRQIKSEVDGFLDDFARELNSLFCDSKGDEFQKWLDDNVEQFYNMAFDGIVEDLRTTNSDLRSDAEDQLKQANEEIEELYARIEELENGN